MFKNTFKDIAYILTSCANNGTRFEIECYDIGHLYTAAPFPRPRPGQAAAVHPVRVRHPGWHRRRIRTTSMHMKRTADRLFGDQYQWSVLGAGRNQMPIATQSVRWAATCASDSRTACGSAGASSPKPTPSRSCEARAMIEDLGLEIATPDDARQILELKGRENVAF